MMEVIADFRNVLPYGAQERCGIRKQHVLADLFEEHDGYLFPVQFPGEIQRMRLEKFPALVSINGGLICDSFYRDGRSIDAGDRRVLKRDIRGRESVLA